MRISIFSCYLVLSSAIVLDAKSSSSSSCSSSSSSISSSSTGSGGRHSAVELLIDSGWHRFHFTGRHSPRFRVDGPGYTQISITDAFCPGESWDILHSSNYILTTPQVLWDNCTSWTDDPDVAFRNDKWSSTTFSMMGKFELQLRALGKPYKRGSAFIRADSRVETCGKTIAPFRLIKSPKGGHDKISHYCKRLNGRPAVIEDHNIHSVAKLLLECGVEMAWIGGITSLKEDTGVEMAWIGGITSIGGIASLKEATEGCLALNVDNPKHPKVMKFSCKRKLPFLCTH